MKLFTKYLYDVENGHGQMEKHYRVYKLSINSKNSSSFICFYYEEFCVIEEFGYAGIIWSIGLRRN